MKIEGRYLFQGVAQQVWNLLTDPQMLQHCTPGCKRLELVGNDEYRATLEIGVGPIKGSFEGKICMTEKEAPHRYKLLVEGSAAVGFVRGEGVLTFQEQESGETAIIVNGDATVGGLVAGVGQRLIEGVAKQTMNQFFKCMQDQLAARISGGKVEKA
jgi:carbon monoxide dehydrogenase subunit G